MNLLLSTFYLMRRALRETARQPAVELGNLAIPLFFFAVSIGSLSGLVTSSGVVENFEGFQLPVAVLQAVAGAAGGAGLAMIVDVERGYFDKLALTPAARPSLLLGRLAADGVKAMVLTAIILAVGLAVGSGMKAGVGGAVVLLLFAGAFGLAYSGIGVAIALRTGSAQAAQLGLLLFFPLLFLSPAFLPKEEFDPWLEFLATLNPVTYILEAQRGLILDGWDGVDLLQGLAGIIGIGIVTIGLAFWALRWRLST